MHAACCIDFVHWELWGFIIPIENTGHDLLGARPYIFFWKISSEIGKSENLTFSENIFRKHFREIFSENEKWDFGGGVVTDGKGAEGAKSCQDHAKYIGNDVHYLPNPQNFLACGGHYQGCSMAPCILHSAAQGLLR